jgi:pentatricopeptide repeat protein
MIAEHASTRRPVPQLSRSSMLDNYPALSHLADPSAQVQSQSESGALGRHNHALRAAAQRGDLGQIVEICRKLSDEGCVPNGFTYQTILRALGSHGLLDEAWAVWEDMEELGIIPTPSCYNHLLEV